MIDFANKLVRSPLLIPAALIALAIRALWYLGVKVKFSNFLSSRIGHLVGNTEVYLCEVDAGMHDGTHIWTHYGEPANAQIDLMLRRVMRIWPQRLTTLAILLNKCFKGWEKHEIGVGTLDRDPRSLLAKYPPHLKFTPAELKRGEATLRQWGISEGAQWVCLMVRDGAYLPQLGYHSYRDCDVDTYEDAALMLANRGYYVFRMGKMVAKPFAAKHPRIFDYATNGMRSDFMDVYLGAYCAFCVSTSTGWDAIPQAFRRPMCYTNFVPFEYLPTWLPNSLAIWKHHSKATLVKVKGRLVNNSWQAYTDTGKETSMGSMLSLADEDLTENDWKRMSVAELVTSGAGKFMQADEFTRGGVSLQDNTPQEILDVVTEMADMMESRFRPAAQEEFWNAFPRSADATGGQPLHGEIRMRIGSKFLRGYDAGREEDTRDHSGARRIEARSVQESNYVQGKAADPVGY